MSKAKKKATIITLDGKKQRGSLPITAHRSNSGAQMHPGRLPIAYWVNGDGTGRTFYGITQEHAFQRALRWGLNNRHDADPKQRVCPCDETEPKPECPIHGRGAEYRAATEVADPMSQQEFDATHGEQS